MAEQLLTTTLPCYCCRESGCDNGCMCTGIDQEAPLVVYDGVSVKPLVENARGMLEALENVLFEATAMPDYVLLQVSEAVAKAKGDQP